MDATDLGPSLKDLASNIDDLEESLAPLLNTALSTSASKLPLLDKSKLYVLATYAIESLLFSFLRLNSVDSKSHPVFLELTRVKQYFEKIKTAESAGIKPNTTLDKGAANRFIKHGLAGNDKYDRERALQLEKEKAGAKRKFEDMTERVGSHTRFEVMSKKIKADEASAHAEQDDNSELVVEHEGQSGVGTGSRSYSSTTKGARRAREEAPVSMSPGMDQNLHSKKQSKKQRRSKADHVAEPTEGDDTLNPSSEIGAVESGQSRRTKSNKPPRGHGEAFQALLQGPLPKQEDTGRRKKRKSGSKGDKERE